MRDRPALAEWEEEGALRELVRLAVGLTYEDFDRDVLPRLRRLTPAQRAMVRRASARIVNNSDGARRSLRVGHPLTMRAWPRSARSSRRDDSSFDVLWTCLPTSRSPLPSGCDGCSAGRTGTSTSASSRPCRTSCGSRPFKWRRTRTSRGWTWRTVSRAHPTSRAGRRGCAPADGLGVGQPPALPRHAAPGRRIEVAGPPDRRESGALNRACGRADRRGDRRPPRGRAAEHMRNAAGGRSWAGRRTPPMPTPRPSRRSGRRAAGGDSGRRHGDPGQDDCRECATSPK